MGLSLVELSIVFVIIGLILGGVLIGRDLIKNSENRAFISQLQSYNAAVNTFKIKYNCLPGDCNNATAYGFTNNGNGNGMVTGLAVEGPSGWSVADYTIDATAGLASTYLGCCSGTEANNVWKHLQNALLIAQNQKTIIDSVNGTVYYLPAAKNDGTGILVTAWAGKHYFHPGATTAGNAGNVSYTLNFSPADAEYIFTKMGGTNIPTTNSGTIIPANIGKDKVIVSNSSGRQFWQFQSQGTGGATASYCIDNSITPAYFNIKNTKKLCSLIIQADF